MTDMHLLTVQKTTGKSFIKPMKVLSIDRIFATKILFSINLFVTNAPFLYSLQTSKNRAAMLCLLGPRNFFVLIIWRNRFLSAAFLQFHTNHLTEFLSCVQVFQSFSQIPYTCMIARMPANKLVNIQTFNELTHVNI